MPMLTRPLLLALALVWVLPLSAQTVLYPGLEGEVLLSAIRADYAPTSVLSYNAVRDELFEWEDDETGGVRAVYTGFTITLTPGADPSADASAQGIDTEHTWPRSRGTDNIPAESDGHHLFPARTNVNSSRGNDPFAEISDATTNVWYRLDQSQTTIPTMFIDEWSETDGGRFEPREDHAGNAARAMFYVEAIYGPQLQSGYFDLQRDDLMDWHGQDPVDAYEAARSRFIATLQGNENPFVLDSTLARRAFTGDGGPGGAGDLLISEYVEGSSFNKAVEFYNAGTEAVNLAGYSLQVFFNGNSGAGTTIQLVGSVAPGDVFVFAASQADPAILAVADQTSGASLFNGDDAVVLLSGATVVDAIGQVGFDPGSEWGMGLTSTQDNTLRRVGMSCTADTNTTDTFDPAVNYTGFASDAFDGLGNANGLDCEDAPEPFVIDASPDVQMVPRGGMAAFTYEVTNNTTSAQSGVVFYEVFRGASLVAGPVRVTSGSLGSGQSTPVLSFSVSVPGGAPLGLYSVEISVGPSNGVAVATDIVAVEVTGGGYVAGGSVWSLVSAEVWPALAAAAGTGYALSAHPNPTSGVAMLGFAVQEVGEVRVAVYDLLGREVALLLNAALEPGEHRVRFDVAGLPSGVYIVRLQAAGAVSTGHVTVTR